MSNNLEEIDRHIEVLSSRWPKPYRQLEDAMVTRSRLVASQIAHHRETTAAYGMAIRKQERIEEAERECAALKARLAEAERDAERYRWLRADMARVDPVMSVVCKVHRDRRSSEWCNIHDLDKTIDAARAADSEELAHD